MVHKSLDVRYILAAYVNSIPTLFKEARPFLKPFPFAWKYNCHFTLFMDYRSSQIFDEDKVQSRVTFIYHKERGYLSNNYFCQPKSLQLLVDFVETLFNQGTPGYEKNIQIFMNDHFKNLDSVSKSMINQILCILMLHSN